jgi:hypothetical protein
MILQIKIEEAQNKFAIVSIVSFQIEVICIFSKRGVYKLIFEDFIHSNCFFVTIGLLRGYFYKIMCNGQQAELNFNLLKPTKMKPLEVLVVLEAPNTASTSCGRRLRYLRPSSESRFSRSLALIFLRR